MKNLMKLQFVKTKSKHGHSYYVRNQFDNTIVFKAGDWFPDIDIRNLSIGKLKEKLIRTLSPGILKLCQDGTVEINVCNLFSFYRPMVEGIHDEETNKYGFRIITPNGQELIPLTGWFDSAEEVIQYVAENKELDIKIRFAVLSIMNTPTHQQKCNTATTRSYYLQNSLN